MPIRKKRQDSSATAGEPEEKRDARYGSARQTLAVFLIALGIASVCFGLYSLIQAFDVFDIAIAFEVWISRSIAALAIGVLALHVGGRRAETL